MQPRDAPPVCSEYPKPCEQQMVALWLPTPARAWRGFEATPGIASDNSSPYLPKIVPEVLFLRPQSAENRPRRSGTKNALVKVSRRTEGMAEIKMRRLLAHIAIATGMMTGVGDAQSLVDQVDFRSASVGGFRLNGVSIYSGYSTSALPLGLGQTAPAGAQELGGSANYGASASFGWQHHRQGTNFSVLYSLTYAGMTRYSDLNALSHSLSMTASRQLTRKWTFTLTGAAQDSTLAEYMYQPSALSVLTQLPATFDDLAAAFSIGQFSNAQMASTLTGAGMLESPARGLLLGNRVLSYSANVGLNYAYSSRLNFHFASFSAGGQNRRGGQSGIPQENYVLPRSIGMNAGMGLSYALSPRTQVGLNVEENRVINRYQNAYTTNGTVSVGRKMGMRWFLSVNGGGSVTQMTQNSYGTPASRQVIGGSSIGFRTYTQTFVASYDRTSSDSYGFAVGTNTTATGSWNWRRPGSRWTISASGGQQQMRGTGFASMSGWEASGGISGRLNAHSTLSAQYVYFNSQGNYVGNLNSMIAHSVRLSLGWNPQTVPTPVGR